MLIKNFEDLNVWKKSPPIYIAYLCHNKNFS